MTLGIDATNIRSGGGLTHLKEIINEVNKSNSDFKKVFIWSNNKTLDELPINDWLIKKTHSWLNKSNVFCFLYQIILLSKSAKKYNCDLLFVPGGSFLGFYKPFVTMSRNMLPFEREERNRFWWKMRLKLIILKYIQTFTFKRSEGVIFLTEYARNYINSAINLKNDSIIIPHGINLRFLNEPKEQIDIFNYSSENPFKLLYVSIVTAYKHQWNVAEAIVKLKNEGYPIKLDLVGSKTESFYLLQKVMEKDTFNVINYNGLIPYLELDEIYKEADAFVFASSCENMPNILIEAMSAGLPIACSNKGPMPEVLSDAGFYFNPTNVDEIYNAIKQMLDSSELRFRKALISYNRTKNYSWKDCSNETFKYLSEISNKYS